MEKPEETKSDNESLDEEGSEIDEQDTFQQDVIRSMHYSESVELPESKELDRSVLDIFQRVYTNVIDEFADVEIFLISMDSLLCEFTAHLYHNWTLAGQTIVLAHQVRAFFERLNDLNAKYKLVWFLDLEHKYKADSILNFVYNYLMAFLDASEWSVHVEKFKNPLDPNWDAFLKRLTPSFLLMSVENPSNKLVRDEVSFISEFVSILVQLVSIGIPVIHFEAFSINFSSVLAYRIKIVPLSAPNLNERISKIWSTPSDNQSRSLSAGECKNHVDFLALVLASELKREKSDADFEKFCLSVLLSAHISLKIGCKRFVPEAEPPKVSDILVTTSRRRVISALTTALKSLDIHTVKFPLDDLWDGRLIYWIFANVIAGRPTLPYRLQEEFAKIHAKVGFKEALPTDDQDALLSRSEENKELLINKCQTLAVTNDFVSEIFKDNQVINSLNYSPDEPTTYETLFRTGLKWRFHTVDERLLQTDQPRAQMSTYELKRENRKRQQLSRWYQAFSDSLEGRSNDLLVDFSRTPRLPTIQESETPADENGAEKAAKKGKGGGAGGKKGGAKGTPKLTKKDQILEANKKNLEKKQIENDKDKIQYATKVKTNAIQLLKDLRRKLQLDESKAVCAFELAQRYADVYYSKAPRCKNIDEKRTAAIDFVGQLKECFLKHWKFLDDAQKDKIQGHWIALGFFKDPKRKMSKEFDLDINIIYYQLYFGGRLIDVQSDPKEDDRVTGFRPDAWQRRMLDVVDKDQSALIVAPTSAGKTFVSYYCIEKVLRQSNDQVVVYVSPSKALINQVCGSVYARFRNKPLSGSTVLFGTMTAEYADNALNCQVLVTIPQCLEQILLSPEPRVQEFVSRIRYVILDEVHSINTAKQGHIWEHIFLLIQCPFLALSATISNLDVMHKWLQSAEDFKKKDRKVELIVYKERWSELELSIQKLRDCPDSANFARDSELFLKGITIGEIRSAESSVAGSLMSLNPEESVLHFFTPYNVYKPEKIRMFSIPDDQQLTARQIIELYTIMAQVDEKIKQEFEPSKFFGFKIGSDEKVWLTRTMLRKLESGLKERFLHWLHHDEEKSKQMFDKLETDVKEDFDKRMKPFNMYRTALYNLIPLLEELKTNEMLPSICFNDNRDFCEQSAIHVFNELYIREQRYMDTPEFKRRFNFKGEDRLAKMAKREREGKEKDKKKKRKRDEDGNAVQEIDNDKDDTSGEAFALMRIKLKEALSQFKLIGRSADEELYDKTIDRLKSRDGYRQSTKILLKLFERGIGFHHDGMTATERGTVEILFRNGNLGIIFSTSTLALGMNMPCKTVVFGIDTPQLTPLQFRQMSGRAGRRGYDPAGNVIFMSLPTSKIRRLLTASLATLRGNVPYTASFLLRLFAYVNGIPEEYQTREEIAEAYTKKIISEVVATSLLQKLNLSEASQKKDGGEKSPLLTKEGRIPAALTLLKQNFALYTRKSNKDGSLPAILQALTFFNIQLLRRLQLIDENGETTGFAKIAVHMGVYEPGNLLFVHLLQLGAFHLLEKQLKEDGDALKETLVLVLAHLFTNRRLPIENGDGKSPIALKPLPEKFEEAICKYNTDMEQLFIASLQLFFPDQQIENEYFRLSGDHEGLNLFAANVVSAFDDDICLDPDFIPSFIQSKDHRGRSIYRNSYAYDFFLHGSKDMLITENKVDISEVWYIINDFNRMLQTLKEVLTYSARVTDPILVAIESIAEIYDKKFRKAFGMRQHAD